MPERSFFYKGIKFPVCARCTGICAGFLLAVFTGWAFCPKPLLLFLLLLPLVADGTLQKTTKYESTNAKRFATGILFGYGLTLLVAVSLVYVHGLGIAAGRRIKG